MSKGLYEKLEAYEQARSLLKIHGMITDSEDRKIKGRIKKFCDKNDIPVENRSIFATKERLEKS